MVHIASINNVLNPTQIGLRHIVGVATAVGCFVLGVALWADMEKATAALPDPVEIGGAALEKPYDKAEGILHMATTIRRNRLCETTLERLITRKSDNFTVWRDRTPGMNVGVSNQFIAHSYGVKIPELESGRYSYRVFVHSDCGVNDRSHVAVNPVEFSVQ